jgi:peptide-methionine (R)-S-oxide reductase
MISHHYGDFPMHRRTALGQLLAAATFPLWLPACSRAQTPVAALQDAGEGESITPIERSRSYWRALLPPERYRILFEEATEPAGSSPLDAETREGKFVCAACYLPLFASVDKYDSGTGWPSFTRPLPGRVGTRTDYKLIWPRTEYHCVRCGGHQGHVFNDGPPPTGLRWCNNGLALEFFPDGEELPALRG